MEWWQWLLIALMQGATVAATRLLPTIAAYRHQESADASSERGKFERAINQRIESLVAQVNSLMRDVRTLERENGECKSRNEMLSQEIEALRRLTMGEKT